MSVCEVYSYFGTVQAQELDSKIQEVHKRIQTERKILEASRLLSLATPNQDVLRRNEAKIKETERSLSYFESTLQELQARKLQLANRDDPARLGLPSSPRLGQHQARDRTLPPTPQPYLEGGPSGGLAPPYSTDAAGFPKPKYSNLDLIKADTPHTTAKITKMLHQLEFKLQVEKQYKEGIAKMSTLYQADGDKKSRADAEVKRVESDRKIALLQSALKRYKTLHILDEAEEEEDFMDGPPVEGGHKANLRSRPLSGKLQVSVRAARELEHAPVVTSWKARSASKQVIETYVSIKVEGTERVRSHPSRTDRWNEDFEVEVDKANEVEITIYDKQVSEMHPVPIGMLWIKLSDLVEAQRRQKVEQEAGQGGWVTADAAGAMGGTGNVFDGPTYPGTHGSGGSGDFNNPMNFPGAPPAGMMPAQSEGVDAWFAVEPAGAIQLRLNFVKENVRKRPLDARGLGRQGAVRQRKGEVHEMNGHKFVQKQFYQVILCAFCSEFLLNATGYQCEDCRYTCHKKCYEKVVTKCISKSTGEDDEDKINHRIPHRFETITNIGANWCCHCGYMLPLGRKNARRCTECGIACHANCAHLVPDFCGMSMETANQLLSEIQKVKALRKDAAGRQAVRPARVPVPKVEPPQQPPTPAQMYGQDTRPSIEGLSTAMDNIQLSPFDQQQAQQHPSTQATSGQFYPQPASGAPAYPYSPGEGPQQTARIPPGARVPEQPTPYADTQPGRYTPAPPDGYHPGGFVPLQQVPVKPFPPGPVAGQPRITQQPPERVSSIPPVQQQLQQVSRPAGWRRKVGLDDFNFLAVLGKGNFGKVMLAEEKVTNKLFAVKVLKKEFIIDNDEVESTRSEKRVFLAASRERHPFLLGLHSCFQTETRVYFVMEYVSGGDLMLHIQRKQFSLRQAKFYASEVLLALEYFHQNGIIYRDLKLDNILLTLDGHVKVADYGLCKEDMWYGSTTSTFCGTPEFMAPEILLEQRYGRAVDWWAFGVLMYEMLLGQSPFRGDDEDEIFDAILEDEPLYPITMPRDAVSILQKLLTRDPNRRLGSGKGDADEIKAHPFFKDVEWDAVLQKKYPPPFCPTIKGSADTSNFDEEFTREQPTLTPVHTQLTAQDQQEFVGFSWVASWADY
ncbi:PKC1 [Sanghuangporus vaninii]